MTLLIQVVERQKNLGFRSLGIGKIGFKRFRERRYLILKRFGILQGRPGFDSSFEVRGKDRKTKENRPFQGWLGKAPGAATTLGWCNAGSTWRKKFSRVPRGRPHYAKKASFNTHSPKPSAMLHALTRPGPKAPRIEYRLSQRIRNNW